MKVVLLKDVKGVGAADTVINVSDGYARNFLFPNRLAVNADVYAVAALEERLKTARANREQELAAIREIAKKIDGTEITISVDAGESGKLFGSVTHADIAEKIRAVTGVEIDKKKIVLDEPIKAVGAFNVPVKFGQDVSATVKLTVSASA